MKQNKRTERQNNRPIDRSRQRKIIEKKRGQTENVTTEQAVQTGKHEKRNTIIASIIIAFLSILLYIQTIPYEYVLDDKAVITNNQYTKKGVGGIMDIMGADIFEGIKAKKKDYVAGGRYRPLSLVTFAIEWEISPNNPAIHHIGNILMYAITGVLIFLLLKKLLLLSSYLKSQNENNPFSQSWFLTIPFVTTMLFIAHPLHTEVIASIKGRDEIMVFLGSLTVLWFSVAYVETKKYIYLILSGIVLFLSLLTKENAITFVAIVPLTIYYFDIKKRNTKTDRKYKTTSKGATVSDYLLTIFPLIVAFIIFMIIRQKVVGGAQITAESKDLMNNPFVEMNNWERYATIFMTLGNYIKLLIFPHPLTFDYYPYHIPKINWSDSRASLSLIMYFAMGIYALIGMKKKKLVSYGIFFYLITFSIVSNIFFSIGAFMSERFMYIPSLGFMLIVSYLILVKLPQFAAKKNISLELVKTVVPAFLLAILALYSFKTIDRNPVWQSEFALFTTDVKTSAKSAKGNYAAGFAYVQKAKEDTLNREKHYKTALEYLEKSVKIHEGFENALIFKGTTHYEYNKDYKKAIDTYFKVLKYYPRYTKVYDYVFYILANHKELSTEYMTQTYEALNKINSDMVRQNKSTYFVLRRIGIAYFQDKKDKQKYQKAIPYLQKAVKANPKDPVSFKILGFCHASIGQLPQAINALEASIRLEPKDAQTLNALAKVFDKTGQTDKANQLRIKLSQLSQKK